jgi:hypothetical protein
MNGIYRRGAHRADNVPDDWDMYWRTCDCGCRYHASDGGCPRCAGREDDEDNEDCDEQSDEEE